MTSNRARPLKVGPHIPTGDGPMGIGIARWRDVLAMARRAEEVGFDSVWVVDHTLLRLDRAPACGRWEDWSLLAALGAATMRIEIDPLVSCRAFRPPALLAKIANTDDEISGGRLILALGGGWHELKFTVCGFLVTTAPGASKMVSASSTISCAPAALLSEDDSPPSVTAISGHAAPPARAVAPYRHQRRAHATSRGPLCRRLEHHLAPRTCRDP